MRNHVNQSRAVGAGRRLPRRVRAGGGLVRCLVVVLVACCGFGVFAGGAVAAGPAPGWEVFGRFGPTVLHPGEFGMLSLYVFNTGGAALRGPRRSWMNCRAVLKRSAKSRQVSKQPDKRRLASRLGVLVRRL